MVAGGVVYGLVDPQHQGHVLALGGGGNDDLLGAAVLVSRGGRRVGEEARRFDDDLDAVVAPRKPGGVALGQDLDLVTVDDDAVVGGLDRARVDAVVGVVLKEVSIIGGVGQVVDRHDHQVVWVPLPDGPEDLPPDSSEAVDSNTSRHWVSPF